MAAPRAWLSQRPVLRAVSGFVLGLILFETVFFALVADSSAFLGYLELIVRASAAVLRGLGFEALADGSSVRGGGQSLDVRTGCDGLRECGRYAVAVLVVPARLRAKLIGLVVGCAAILALNVVRVVTLFIAYRHYPGSFQALHLSVWPIVLLLFVLALWLAWARRCASPLGSRA